MAADMRTRAVIALITYLIVIFLVGFVGQATLLELLLGFLPSILFMLFVYSAYHAIDNKLLIILPVLLSIFFIGFGFLGVQIIKDMEFVFLGFFNMILSYLVLGFIHLDDKHKPKKKHPHYYTPYVKEVPTGEEAKPSTLEGNLQSIVANCKALNHVIGRVYSSRNGGSEQLRHRVRIQPEVYHDIEQNLKEKKFLRVKELLDYLQQKINLFSHQEHAVFGDVHLKNLHRDTQGMHTIEQVLVHNDNDPVQSYLKSIKSSIKFIGKRVAT